MSSQRAWQGEAIFRSRSKSFAFTFIRRKGHRLYSQMVLRNAAEKRENKAMRLREQSSTGRSDLIAVEENFLGLGLAFHQQDGRFGSNFFTGHLHAAVVQIHASRFSGGQRLIVDDDHGPLLRSRDSVKLKAIESLGSMKLSSVEQGGRRNCDAGPGRCGDAGSTIRWRRSSTPGHTVA